MLYRFFGMLLVCFAVCSPAFAAAPECRFEWDGWLVKISTDNRTIDNYRLSYLTSMGGKSYLREFLVKVDDMERRSICTLNLDALREFVLEKHLSRQKIVDPVIEQFRHDYEQRKNKSVPYFFIVQSASGTAEDLAVVRVGALWAGNHENFPKLESLVGLRFHPTKAAFSERGFCAELIQYGPSYIGSPHGRTWSLAKLQLTQEELQGVKYDPRSFTVAGGGVTLKILVGYDSSYESN